MFLLVMFLITPKGEMFQSSPQVFHAANECQMALAMTQHQLDEELKGKDGLKYTFKCLEWQ